MAWLILEAAVALAIGLFIVWWTWPKSKPAPPPASDRIEPPASKPPRE